MSAIVCGKRSFFEDLPTTPPVSKRLRCSSTSPIRFSPPRTPTAPISPSSASFTGSSPVAAAIEQLRAIFPDMDNQLLERALEESDDLESAIKRLNELRLGSETSEEKTDPSPQGVDIPGRDVPSEDLPAFTNLPRDGAEWVELFVSEMSSASSMDDAKSRASRVLEVLEKSIRAHAGAETAGNVQKEIMILKQQVEVLSKENYILKRAVAIQNERQKEFDHRSQELQHLKQLVVQYQEKLRTLEVNNYALSMHLKQAQQSNSIPGRFHPDVF